MNILRIPGVKGESFCDFCYLEVLLIQNMKSISYTLYLERVENIGISLILSSTSTCSYYIAKISLLISLSLLFILIVTLSILYFLLS
jgi:hypothetical protein